MRIAAVIVAAGRGTRAGASGPKQWQTVAGRRVADWTLARFAAHPKITRCVTVTHPDDARQAQSLAHTEIVQGGATRAASVRAGLEHLRGSDITHVLIHDVARCTVPAAVIDGVIDALHSAQGAAPAVAVSDALWTGAQGRVSGTQDRAGLFRAQTPQGFALASILAAHGAASGVEADDVEIARAAGIDVTITQDGTVRAAHTIDQTGSGYDAPHEYMYFKAGLYNQNHTGRADDYAQATFYEINASHD